ncbi:MAG: CRISPR-associated endonuclease Cas3'', partial [Planctomycetota bacterium]
MSTLTVNDFPEFFQTIHGHPPFAWQQRLLQVVLDEGWTHAISLPTASGKTAVLDIAVFALALEAALPAEDRKTPRRIALVVDRRIVVDDAFRRAKRISKAIQEAKHQMLTQVAEALQSLGGDPTLPLDCAALRGGIPKETRWARTPLQP